ELLSIDDPSTPEAGSSSIIGKRSSKAHGRICTRRSRYGPIHGLVPGVITEYRALNLAPRAHPTPEGKFLVPSAVQDQTAVAPDEVRRPLQCVDGRLLRKNLCTQAVGIRIRLN